MDFNNLERKTKAELFELIQSKQAEIDALKAELAKHQREGYKLIPVEPSKEKLKEIEEKCFKHPDCFGIDCPLDVIYRAIAGDME